MHLDHIVSLITKVAAEHPEARQDIIDLATLGYRDGLIQGKLNEIANSEDMDPSEIDEGDLAPSEMDEIIADTENWFRNVMSMNARQMAESHEEEERVVGEQYLREGPRAPMDHDKMEEMRIRVKSIMQSIMGNVDITGFKPIPVRAKNRVQIHMDELSKENPGLFD